MIKLPKIQLNAIKELCVLVVKCATITPDKNRVNRI